MKRKMFVILLTIFSGLVGTIAYAEQPQTLKSALNWAAGLFYSEPVSADNFNSPKKQAVSSKNETLGASQPTKTSAQNKSTARDVPDYITFDVLFSMVGQLEREADRLESEGRSGKIWRDYLKERGGLTGEELLIVKEVAKKFTSELEPVHNRALEIIKERRAKYPNGLAQKDEKMPPPTAELEQLQQRRQEIALQNRDFLESRLGASSFERLRNFSRQKFSNGDARIFGEEELRQLKERAEKGAAENKMILSNEPQEGDKNQ